MVEPTAGVADRAAGEGIGDRLRRTAYVARTLPARRLGAMMLVLAIAASGGTAIAAAIGARRAQHSVAGFLRLTAAEDAQAYTNLPASTDAAAALRKVARLPGVTRSRRISLVVVGFRLQGGQRAGMVAENTIDPLSTRRPVSTPYLLSGRLPDPRRVDEVAINRSLANLLHVDLGGSIPVSLYTAAQLDDIGGGHDPKPLGGIVRMHVVAIVRVPHDLEKPGTAPTGINTAADGYLSLTPAFWRTRGKSLASYVTGSLLRLSVPVGVVRQEAKQAGLPVGIESGSNSLRDPASVRRSTHIESGALWILAGLVALVGIALLGPALRRQVAVRSADEQALVAVGATRRGLAGVEVLRALPIVALGAFGAVFVGAFLAPHTAFGTSGLAEVTRPVQWPVAVLGAGALAVFTAGLGVVLLGRLSRRSRVSESGAVGDVTRGAGRVLNAFAGAGAPCSVVVGALLALPAQRRNGTTIRSAVATVAVGVALLVAALTFSANMTHLVASPTLRGWNWDYEVGNYSAKAGVRAAQHALRTDPDVAAFTGFNTGNFEAGGRPLGVAGIKDIGMARLPVFSGRLPARAGEIAVTRPTLTQLGVKIGDHLTVVGTSRRSLRIVGTTVGPGALSQDQELSHGGLVGFADLRRLQLNLVESQFLVRFRPGVDRQAALHRLEHRFPNTVVAPFDSPEITTLRRAEPLPLVLAGIVTVLAFGTLVYGVASALRHRRREVALLKALGFDRRQLRVASLVQAGLLAVLAVIVGIPIGLLLGRWTWTLAARTVGVVVAPVLPLLAAATVGVVALAVALVVGAVSSRAVTRVPAASTLRPE
ncbi:MAG: hypothetical protein JWL73_185 [Actinomycetia bacterium]|nr:hypothetical protein [Actinomycetes bacterium]